MRVNFSVTNQLATPSIHAAALANRPPAGQPGRLFVDTDNPSSGIYRDTGTVWENITGGAGAGNLQTVTDAGNTTDNNILLTYADNTIANALVFYNDALTQEEYLIEKRGTGITTNDSLVIQSRGNISPSTNPVGFLIDGANDVIKSFYTTSYTTKGLLFDFVNDEYYFGNVFTANDQIQIVGGAITIGNNIRQIELTNDPIIKTKYNGNDIGLKLDFPNELYYFGGYSGGGTPLEYGLKVEGANGFINLGDYSGQYGAATYLQFDFNTDVIKTTKFGGNDIGLYLDFTNNNYLFGDFTGNTQGNLSLAFSTNNFVIESLYSGNTSFSIFDDGSQQQLYLGIQNNASNNIIKTNFAGNDVGLKLDFANYSYYFGDFAVSNSGTYFLIDDNNQVIESYCVNVGPGGNGGLQLDFGTNKYSLGDYNNGVSGTSIIVDDLIQLIKTENNGNDIGLKLDFANGEYNFGDFDSIVNGTAFAVDDTNQKIVGIYGGTVNGIELDFANSTYKLGDISSNFIGVDHANNKLIASTNLLVGSSGSTSGQHLKIKVGTTDYVIELKNP